MVLRVEIQIDRAAAAAEMAQSIFGDGAQVISASHSGDQESSDIYTNSDTIAPGGEAVQFAFLSEEHSEYSTVAFLDFVGVWINSSPVRLGVDDGDTEVFDCTCDVQSSTGETDVGIVTVDSVPCFIADTLVLTPGGEVAAETQARGGLMITQDDGAQPLRWIGQRRVAAQGEFAPIRIAADAFGSHREWPLSPLHRVLIRDNRAELLSDESEGLVSAPGTVDYIHILSARHPVVFSEGLATESFLPGPQVNHSFEADIVREICTLFPEIDPETGQGYSGAARRTLKRYEARLLMAQGRAA